MARSVASAPIAERGKKKVNGLIAHDREKGKGGGTLGNRKKKGGGGRPHTLFGSGEREKTVRKQESRSCRSSEEKKGPRRGSPEKKEEQKCFKKREKNLAILR